MGGGDSFTDTVIFNLLIPSCLVTAENKFLRTCAEYQGPVMGSKWDLKTSNFLLLAEK